MNEPTLSIQGNKLVGRVKTEGDEIYFEVRGPAQGSGAPALLLIPGARGEGGMYFRVAKLLSDEFRVISYDRRANARSSGNPPQNFQIDQQSRDAAAVIRAAGEERAFVFGNSSGAVIALDMAKTQPQVTRAVVAHEPPMARVHPDAHKWQRFYAEVYLTGCRFGGGLAMLQFLIGTGLPVRDLIKAAQVSKEAEKVDGEGEDLEQRIDAKAMMDFFAKQELLPVTNYLPDVQTMRRNGVPVFMAAGQDSLTKKRWYAVTAQVLAGQLGCDFVTFPGHHGSYLDQPEAWGAVLRATLKRTMES